MQQLTSRVEGGIVYEPSLFGNPDAQLFEADYWQARGTGSVVNGGRGQVLFIRDDTHQRRWVLRHYRRGGLIAKFNKDLYWWSGAEATRSFREWRLLAKLVELSLPAPTPVAARYMRDNTGLFYRADLITQEIDGARSLSSLLERSSFPTEQWHQIGSTLAQFHKHGVHHADLNAHNIVFDADQRVFVLDFDRGVIRTPKQEWIDGVLSRLLRSLNKLKVQRNIHFLPSDWDALKSAHDAAMKAL
jgi:3-deoxy-D-manno-octulosonic acid kinase